MIRAPHALAFALLMGLGAAGCSFAAAGDSIENVCATDADCPAGFCNPDVGVCESNPPSVLQIGLQILPMADAFDSDPSAVTLGILDIGGPRALDVEMPIPITVFGVVRTEDGARVPADLTFTHPAAFPGVEPVRVRSATLAMAEGGPDGETMDYGARLVAGQRYDLTVRPTGDAIRDLPPIRIEVELPALGDEHRDGNNVLRLDTPAWSSSLRRVAGRIVTRGADGVEVGQAGLTVRAVDAESQVVVSSTATTRGEYGGEGTEEDGSFGIVLSPGAGPYLLRIGSSDARPTFPSIDVDPSFFFPGDPDAPITVLVPEPARFCYQARVYASTPSDLAVANAVVELRSDNVFDASTGVAGRFTQRVTTDDGGVFTAELMAADYEIVITPPDRTSTAGGQMVELGVHVAEASLAAPSDPGTCLTGQEFRLPHRFHLGGHVFAQAMAPMSGAVVEGIARSNAPGEVRNHRSSTTTTDALGLFDLPLDVGTYDVVVKPPASSGFAWSVRHLPVGATGETFSEDVHLPPPVPLTGAVLTADGRPLSGAVINAFGIVTAADGSVRTTAIGRAEVAEDGTYRLRLPPSIE